MSKYGCIRTSCDGYTFASKLEASVYQILKQRLAAKEVIAIECQVCVYLSKARILYMPDFKLTLPNGELVYAEAKGFEGSRWPTIKKLWKWYGPGPLEIWKGTHFRPCLVETLIPKGTHDDE